MKLKMKVREVREGRHPRLSQHRLAELAGIDQAALCRIEGGNVNPTIVTLDRLAVALGVEVTALYERT
jgi:transcriptional regulator with XRE-family HTH domain